MLGTEMANLQEFRDPSAPGSANLHKGEVSCAIAVFGLWKLFNLTKFSLRRDNVHFSVGLNKVLGSTDLSGFV